MIDEREGNRDGVCVGRLPKEESEAKRKYVEVIKEAESWE